MRWANKQKILYEEGKNLFDQLQINFLYETFGKPQTCEITHEQEKTHKNKAKTHLNNKYKSIFKIKEHVIVHMN